MKELVLSIAKTLLSKNIPFGMYLFPREKDINLSIDAPYLPHKRNKRFRMTPFTENAMEKELFWEVLEKEYLTDDFLKKMEAVSPQKTCEVSLSPSISKTTYFSEIASFLKMIRNDSLEKAILSRVFYENKPTDFDPIACFLDLTYKNPNAFVYLTLHPESGLWIGASPELLLKKNKDSVATIALAGTQEKREDSNYQWREKEKEEHRLVGEHIEDVFEKNGYLLSNKNGPFSIETDSVAHLQTNYNFQSQNKTALESLIKQLHPTPAIAGMPIERSLECIRKYETTHRKYYCGVIGETDEEENANLYVNLRCMQIGKDKISIYVGGGITADSDPVEEWRETILKGKTMLESIQNNKAVNA